MARSSAQRCLRGGFAACVGLAVAACGSAYTASVPDAGTGPDAATPGIVTTTDEDAMARHPSDSDVDAGADGGPGLTGAMVLFIAVPARRSEVTSVADADTLCMARLPPGVKEAKALLVGSGRRACLTTNCGNGTGEHKDWPLLPSTTYTRADRTTVVGVTNGRGLFDELATSIGTENNVFAWTGLNPSSDGWTDWTTGDTCSSWSTTTGTTTNGPFGQAGYTGPLYAASAFGKFEDGCAKNFVFYCAEIVP